MRKQYSATFKVQIVQEVLRGEKTMSQIAAAHDVPPNLISLWKATAIERFPSLFERENADRDAERVAHDQQLRALDEETGRLTTHVAILKKKPGVARGRSERVALIEHASGELALSVQADLLGVSRSSLPYRPVAPSAEEVSLKQRIGEIFTAHPFYGSRRITAQLRRDTFVVNRKAVQRHMEEMGLAAIGPKPNLSKPAAEHRVFPYLLSDVVASSPNHIWGIDLTYVRLAKGWLYLVAILDWFSRFVVAWELDQTLELDFVLAAVDRALAPASPP
ncbi:MAG TPA: IS3 family transposase [Chloroflexota bacterium]|nr:IS3 family transposase [Chloroflexota bacterium]